MKDKVVVREMSAADIDGSVDLILRLKKLNGEFDSIFVVSDNAKKDAEDRLKEAVKNPERHISLLAERGGKVLGVMLINILDRCYYLPEKEARITDFYIMPEFRRSGAGKMLISRSYEELKKRKISIITAEFPSQNLIALRFYKSLGYREIVGIYGKVLEEE
ncbi:MAG: GNAT family N-acetyltransferase [Candidatus Thermoplasmatota archaeon]|jgi:ribosomal protein S18 acetylase RimI-like enzyme|nr:GNAT family N-acetyltransferase [Candidatus Thermoplasmatota archaeon]MCL4444178.1 GNAT family N-acetyltransferase [Candidatus Thermoplasmatota archaeon]MCL5732474.1 GNAT family N-acetyltransferase [Candidatus Thermoplasmatota archaeon]WMT44237.1 MAG: GNAT family N-acetyltransferase [Cuniculiplasma divulgatum]